VGADPRARPPPSLTSLFRGVEIFRVVA
jgi:hypothetical protein